MPWVLTCWTWTAWLESRIHWQCKRVFAAPVLLTSPLGKRWDLVLPFCLVVEHCLQTCTILSSPLTTVLHSKWRWVSSFYMGRIFPSVSLISANFGKTLMEPRNILHSLNLNGLRCKNLFQCGKGIFQLSFFEPDIMCTSYHYHRWGFLMLLLWCTYADTSIGELDTIVE